MGRNVTHWIGSWLAGGEEGAALSLRSSRWSPLKGLARTLSLSVHHLKGLFCKHVVLGFGQAMGSIRVFNFSVVSVPCPAGMRSTLGSAAASCEVL